MSVDVGSVLYVDSVITDNGGECTIFRDTNKTVIAIVHGNDGNWRSEYFNPIIEAYGVVVETRTLSEDDANALYDSYFGMS